MASMGRAPYHKFYKRDAAEDKQIACNALRFEGYAGQQFSTLSGDERHQGLIGQPLAQEACIPVLDDVSGSYVINVYCWKPLQVKKRRQHRYLTN